MNTVRLNAFFYSFELPLDTVARYSLPTDPTAIAWYKGARRWYLVERLLPACQHWFPPSDPTLKKRARSCSLACLA